MIFKTNQYNIVLILTFDYFPILALMKSKDVFGLMNNIINLIGQLVCITLIKF